MLGSSRCRSWGAPRPGLGDGSLGAAIRGREPKRRPLQLSSATPRRHPYRRWGRGSKCAPPPQKLTLAVGPQLRYNPPPEMRIRVDAERTDPRKLEPAIEALRRGEVIIYPTDTGYAFGCAMSSSRGINALRKLKGFDERHWKPLTMLVDGVAAFGRYGALDNTAFRAVRRILPGPYTIVMRATADAPKSMRNRKHEIGLRWPSHRVCELLVGGLAEPLL